MTVRQAVRFHQEKLNLNLTNIANAALNPKINSVYYMRKLWLKDNPGSLGGGDTNDSDDTQMPSTLQHDNTNKFEENTSGDDNDPATSNHNKPSKPFVDKLKLLHDSIYELAAQYEDEQSLGALERLIDRVGNVRSSNQLNSLLQCTGVALPSAGRGRIPCQPTSIARHQQGMPRGAAPISKGRKRKGNLIDKTLDIKKATKSCSEHCSESSECKESW